jgi:hypothetical protein
MTTRAILGISKPPFVEASSLANQQKNKYIPFFLWLIVVAGAELSVWAE